MGRPEFRLISRSEILERHEEPVEVLHSCRFVSPILGPATTVTVGKARGLASAAFVKLLVTYQDFDMRF